MVTLNAASTGFKRQAAGDWAALPRDNRRQGEDWAVELYLAAAAAVGPCAEGALRVGIGGLAARLRHASDRRAPPGGLARIADDWARRWTGEANEVIRRALVANLALALAPRGLPPQIASLYPAAHDRLARSLATSEPYETSRFEQDLAFACGAFLPIGCLWLATPSTRSLAFRMGCAKQNLGLAVRRRRTGAAMQTLNRVGAAWAELHVDPRHLREFDAAGFARGYHRIAALLEMRPDLAGVRGASWLYDPQLTEISPALGFVLDPIRAGAELLPLKTDQIQIEYALMRSAVRRRLWREGRYRPACYGLYWRREALIDWSRMQRGAEASPL